MSESAEREAPEVILPLFSSDDPELAEQIDEHMGGFGERPFRLLPQDAPPV